MKFHVDGSQAKKGEIFVFGSNLGGQHNGGAARAAELYYGAVRGVGVGPTGQSYAIPTVTADWEIAKLADIAKHVEDFKKYAAANPDKTFFVTAIGCGIAGFTHAQIAPLFKGVSENCDFPEPWREFLS